MEEGKSGGRNNATKHGAFAQDLILADEDVQEFEQLHQSVIADWSPVGATEEHAVYILAQCLWANYRVERYHVNEMALIQKHRLQYECDEINSFTKTLNNAKDEMVANRIIGLLPERYSKWLARKFPRSNYDDANSWIQALTSSAMPKIQEIHAVAAVKERGSLQFKIDQAARVRDLMEKKLKLDERVDSRTDKAIRRLVQLKTLRQVIGLQVVQAKSIEHDGTSA
jgi:hypothetical protein